MSGERLDVADIHERTLLPLLNAAGGQFRRAGAGGWAESVRSKLRAQEPPDLRRWQSDLVGTAREGWAVRVDAKWHYAHNPNIAIEMRSVLAARLSDCRYYFASAAWDGQVLRDHITFPLADLPARQGCCAVCFKQFVLSRDPNAELPRYCPVAKQRSPVGSGTPYVLVRPDDVAYPTLYGDPLLSADADSRVCTSCPHPLPRSLAQAGQLTHLSCSHLASGSSNA